VEHFNYIPKAFADEIRPSVTDFLSNMRAMYDDDGDSEEVKKPDVQAVANDFANFQQKVEVMPVAQLMDQADMADLLDEDVSASERLDARKCLEGHVATRQRQELVVVASLVGKLPNLGGLARTCEIFNAGKLVIGDMSVAKDKNFQSVAVTADKWLPMEEVKPADIEAYLWSMREQGYTIIALEQSANSVSLPDYTFPAKVVLLLGKEKEGVPISLLNAVDQCIEIPQFGLIRSLNVHVSGSLMLWEYTRQRLCKSSE
jgi:tRNA G18 (ribose-2'-O)-methylase SpoU